MAAASKSKKFWNFIDHLGGDKVVWIIVLTLMLLSIVCIFSSTSRLLSASQTRVDMVKDQLITVLIGIVVIVVCFSIRNIKVIRWLSQWGFLISMVFLVLLDTGGVGFIKAQTINGATRTLGVGGVQIHVFEIVKVAMVMYLAWAVDALEKDSFKTIKRLSKIKHLEWLGTKMAKKIIYIYLPFVVSTIGILPGSNTSALFIGAIMFLTIVIGGGNLKDALVLMFIGGIALGGCLGLYTATKTSEHPVFERIGTAFGRLSGENYEKNYKIAIQEKNSAAAQKAIDKLRQPYSAKIAIHQGGLIGKGPGQSTQRYVVPDMSEDFMFSFIVEEYGLLGAIIVIALFVSLLARGSLIARNCGNNLFAKAAVAGLTLLITGQAFLHMFVNADIGPLTGQTLPLISHGTSAFVCFSAAFGIILSISRIAAKRVAKEEKEARQEALRQEEKVEMAANLDTLEQLETQDFDDLIDIQDFENQVDDEI